MNFPYENIPDGAVMAPHHFYIGIFLACIFCAVVWDNKPHEEPLFTVLGLSGSLFAFLLIWPWYSVVGAFLTLICLGVATISLSRGPWKQYPLRWRIAVFICILIAWDDLLEHAFGWGIILGPLWDLYIHPHMM